MQPAYPLTKDIVLIGGGHCHALVLKRWGMNPLPGVRLTVINPDPTTPYTGMLPGHIAGHYPRDALEIDLVRLARFAGARLILGWVTGIDRARQMIAVPGRPDIAYDIASLDIGITSDMPDLPGFSDHGHPAKPLGGYAAAWETFVAQVAAGQHLPQIVILGGGVAGIELALASAHRLKSIGIAPEVTVLQSGPTALPGLGQGARTALIGHMARLGVALILNARATQITATEVILQDRSLPSQFTIGAAGAKPHPWLADTGLTLNDGFISIAPDLRSQTDPTIFAVGDCAHMAHAPRPKAGVFAVRQAPMLFANLRAAVTHRPLARYQPQRDYLKLISTGGKGAVADKFGLRMDGAWLWRLKHRIDQRFMAKLSTLPAMPRPAVPVLAATGVAEALADKPLCGGCGAKVGRADLMRGLTALPQPKRPDILSGPGDDAAVLAHGAGQQVFTTDHLRSFTLDPWLMTRITAIHALGDIWAMGAAPQAALSQIILPAMSATLQARTLAEITDASVQVLHEAGADLVGGHTSIGTELTLGFTLTGLMSGTQPAITKGGAKPGDRLILTKPLGTGVILAAEMVMAAPGAAVAAALHSMAQPQSAAAAILAPHAHAMTDVTGFGLAGHLIEMLHASHQTGPDLRATLTLTAVPLLPGAEALAAAGHRSSLYPANRSAAALMTLPDTARADLLFDPQTAGGLLAAVPPDTAATLLAALNSAGYTAALIGNISQGTTGITVLP